MITENRMKADDKITRLGFIAVAGVYSGTEVSVKYTVQGYKVNKTNSSHFRDKKEKGDIGMSVVIHI